MVVLAALSGRRIRRGGSRGERGRGRAGAWGREHGDVRAVDWEMRTAGWARLCHCGAVGSDGGWGRQLAVRGGPRVRRGQRHTPWTYATARPAVGLAPVAGNRVAVTHRGMSAGPARGCVRPRRDGGEQEGSRRGAGSIRPLGSSPMAWAAGVGRATSCSMSCAICDPAAACGDAGGRAGHRRRHPHHRGRPGARDDAVNDN